MRVQTRIVLAALALLVLSGVVGREVYFRLIVPAPPLNFDEAAHSLEGFYILRDVLKLDARELWVNTHAQTLWPPGFSYLQAPFLLLLGVSDQSARIFAFAMLALTALMGCVVAFQIDERRSALAALIGGVISLTAPGWLFVGSWANQETPVAFLLFVVFWLFLRAMKTRGPGRFALTGAALFGLFLTKYNYAAFAVAAIGLVDAIERIKIVRKDRTRIRAEALGMIALYAPLALGLLFWFFGGQDVVPKEVKWRDFSFFVSNEDSGYVFWSAQNLLFYIRAAGNWLMPSGLLALAAGAGAVYAVARMRHPGITTLAIFFGIGFVLATIHPLKSERYMTPLFPSLWLLTGFGAARLWDDMRARRLSRPLLALVAIAPAVVSVWSLAYWMPRLEPVWAGVTAQGLRASADQVVTWQQPGKPLLIIGTFGELGPPYFEWRFRPVQAFAASGAPIQYDAPPGDGTNYERVLNWARANPGAQITTIRVAPGSNLDQTNDMRNKNAWRQTLSADFERAPVGYRLVDRRQYPESGLTVSYYLPVAP